MGFSADIVKVIVDWLKPQVTLERVQAVLGKSFSYRTKDQRELFVAMHRNNPLYESRKRQLDGLWKQMEEKSCHVVKIFGANEMGKDIFAAHLYQKMSERKRYKPFLICPVDSQSIGECMDAMFEKRMKERKFYRYLRKHPCFLVLQNAELFVDREVKTVNAYDILKSEISEKRCKSRLILLYNKASESDMALNKEEAVEIELEGLNLEADGAYFRKKFTKEVPADSFLKLFFESCDRYPGVMEMVVNKLKDMSLDALGNFKRSEDFQRLYSENGSEKYRVALEGLAKEERKLLQYLTLRSPRTERELSGVLEKKEYELETTFRSLKEQFYIDREGKSVSIRNTIRHQIYCEMVLSGINAVKNHNLMDMDLYLLHEAGKENGSDTLQNAEVLKAVCRELGKEFSEKAIRNTLGMMLEESDRKDHAYEYAITNALNLLIYMKGSLSGLDLSGLPVGAVDFSGLELRDVDLRGADVRKARFNELLDRITCCKFHPGGNFFVTGGVDGNLIFWNNETWQKINHIPGHKNTVWDIAFSPDGKYLASCGDDATLQIWNIEHIEEQDNEIALLYDKKIPSLQKKWMSCLAWHGNELMVAGGDGWIYCYDFANKTINGIYEGYGEEYHSLRFSPDGSFLLAGTRDGTLLYILHPMKSGDSWKCAKTIKTKYKHISAIAFPDNSSGNEFLIGGEQGKLVKWERKKNRLTEKWVVDAHKDMITGIQIADGGETIVTGSHDGTVKLWTKDGGVKGARIFQKNPSKIHRICVRGDWILACCADASIWILNVGSTSSGCIQGSSSWCSNIALNKNGTYLAASCADACIRIWNLQTGVVSKIPLESQEEMTSVAVSPDGRMLAAGSSNGILYLWNLNADGKVNHKKKCEAHSGAIRRMTFLTGTYRLISASGNDQKVYCHRLEKNKSQIIMSDKPKILCTSFPYWLGSIDVNLEKGLLAYTSGWARIQISKFDDSGIENLKEVEAYGSTYQSIAISPDGTRLAATTDDGRLILWKIEEGEEKTERQVSDYHTGSVVFSPDGRFLAVGDSGGFLCIVDSDTLRVLDRAEISSRAILALVFASDARTVYASGEEGNVLVCKIKEDTVGMVRIEKESVMRRTNCYAGMKIRKNDLPRIRLYSLESQGAEIEEDK